MFTFMIVLIIFLLFLWLPLLIIGIFKVRKDKKPFNIFLVVLACIWGFLATTTILIALIGLIGTTVFHVINNNFKTTTFDKNNYKGDTATLTIEDKANGFAYFFSNKEKSRIKTSITDGKMELPTGSYQFLYLSLTKDDWQASVHNTTVATILLEKDKEALLKAGSPFNARIIVSKNSFGVYTFSCSLEDNFHNNASFKHKNSASPGFQLLDQQGKVLWKKYLEYG